MPADIQEMMRQAAKLASLDYMARGAQLDASATKTMKESGIEFIHIPADEWSKMEQNVRVLWAEYAKEDDLSARAVKMLQEYLTELGR